MPEHLHFRISSALKDIIGRDLITDDYIAVFELVKNSYDAYASRVDIYFENIYSNEPKIIIKDDGKGMDYEDLLNKWLFVAYSAKKEGTEDVSFDYRDRISINRVFAGAKGIGRFSCDRLGKKLYLETTKQTNEPKTEVLITDWEKFENNIQDEFIEIGVEHETKNESSFELLHGTVLEITSLRSEWNRYHFLKLKDSLAKLINPAEDNTVQDFKIFIHVEEEITNDENQTDEKEKVNGEVKNFIFEALGLKTTKIVASISDDKNFLTTELKDGGTLIYNIKEKNQFQLLAGIRITIFYLNQSAKLTFARRMGVSSRAYGHIFLYKNGFRIYPFGEPYEDPLKIDVRKSRKIYSYLGTGEIMGQIEIFGINPELKETSSRGDGLIKNIHYEQLQDFFFIILERLEKYVVEVQQWGLSIEDENLEIDIKQRITNLIVKLTGSDEIIDVKYSDDFLDILKDSQTGSAENVFQNLNRIALENGNNELIENVQKTTSKFYELKRAKEDAEKEAEIEKEKAKGAIKELENKESENLFLRSVKSQDFDEIISFLHHVGISAGIIDNYLTGLFNKVRNEINIPNSQLLDILNVVVFENKKIQNISSFATKANFKLYTDAVEIDLNEYIREYINNVVNLAINENMQVKYSTSLLAPYIGLFRPIEINILIDNFLNNSKKAQATLFEIKLGIEDNKTVLSFSDNGKGIPESQIAEIYKYGFTTTSEGSGLGLYHIKEIVDRMQAKITVESKINTGTTFKIILP